MQTVTLEEAQSHLLELIKNLQPGQEIIITLDQKPIARLASTNSISTPRKLGTMKGTVKYMSPDFDEPLEDMSEHMH